MWSSVTSKWQRLSAKGKLAPYGLGLAVLLSLLLHGLMLGGEYWSLPDLVAQHEEQHLQVVSLQANKPLMADAQLPKPKVSAKPKLKPKTKPQAESLPQAEPLAEANAETAADAAPNAILPENSAAEQTEGDSPATAEALQQNAASADEQVQEEQRTLPQFSYVDTEFKVLRGANGSKIGVSHIRYRALPDGRYELTSTTEAQGLAALVVSGKLLQQSTGSITEQGLRPDYFSYQYGSSESKKQQSRFDWAQHTLSLETAKGIQTVPLPDGTQDLLSVMYQFVFVPPLEQMSLSVSNGRKLTAFNYEFEGEEVLNTEFGVVNTLHIAKVNQTGSEKTELWLAVDYLYLPVKMRKTEEDGSVIEQMAVRISTDLLK